VVNVAVLVLRRDPVEHEHFRVPSAIPVLGVGISIALLTQIEGEVFARAGILIGIGVGLWLLNELIVRRLAAAEATASA
jgi:low temperature requirement protein LtrA